MVFGKDKPTKEQLTTWAKLGGVASHERKEKRVNTYNKNPKLCLYCKLPLPYNKQKQTFCNHSCSSSFNNFVSTKHRNPLGINGYLSKIDYIGYDKPCDYCGKIITRNKKIKRNVRVFCSSKHQALYATEQKLKNKTHIKEASLRYYLINTRGYKCEECGLTQWRGEPIPLETHHIDGDALNNKLINLMLMCKNCHGLTDNYGAKNIGKGTRPLAYKKRTPPI